jgi:hypothetical protein
MGFWWWCITHRINGFLNLLHHPEEDKKHDISETGSVSILRWGETPTLLGPSERVVQWLRLTLSKGPNRVGVSLHLRMETDPVSETSCFLSSNSLESGQWTKSENPLILYTTILSCVFMTTDEVWIKFLFSSQFLKFSSPSHLKLKKSSPLLSYASCVSIRSGKLGSVNTTINNNKTKVDTIVSILFYYC